jgi:hypothetical protein
VILPRRPRRYCNASPSRRQKRLHRETACAGVRALIQERRAGQRLIRFRPSQLCGQHLRKPLSNISLRIQLEPSLPWQSVCLALTGLALRCLR